MDEQDTLVEQTAIAEETDTRDVVARELDKLETPETDRARDEKGRFAPKEAVEAPEKPAEEVKPVKAVEPKPEEQKPVEAVEQPVRNPWSSWKREAQAELSKLPEHVQGMIQERERQFHKGLDQYRELASRAKSYDQAIAPHMDYLRELNVTPEQAVTHLIAAERTLRTGNEAQRAEAFLKLAHDYGINVSNLSQTSFDPFRYDLEQKLAQQQAKLDELTRSRQTAEEAHLSQTVEGFAQTHEHFDDVRDDMALLLEAGKATDLEDAYEKALRLNGIAPVMAQQPATVTPISSRADQAAKAARASAVSVKGAPTGVTRPPAPKTTEEAVRLAMAEMGL